MSTIATLFCVACALLGDDPDKIELRIRPTAMVRGMDVRVGDFCDVLPVGRDALTIAELSLGPAPVLGYARTFSRTELLQALAKGGFTPASVKFEGASEAVVQTIGVDVAHTELLDAASTALRAVLDLEGGDTEFETPTNVRRVQAPPGRKSQELLARVRSGKTSLSSAVVDVDIQVDGESFRRVPVTFKLTRFQQVLRTIGPIREGTQLGPHNLELAREAVPQAASLQLGTFQAVDGMVAARDLQGGRRLLLSDSAPPAAVHRGETVTVVVNSGRIKVSARAIANHDAPIGGHVTLTNPDSKRQISGIVMSHGLVVAK